MAIEQQLIARFQADLTDLEKGVAQATKAITSVPTAADKASGKATQSFNRLGQSVKLLGRSAGDIGAIFGTQGRLLGMATNQMAQAVDGALDVIGLLGASSPVILGAVAGIGTLGYALRQLAEDGGAAERAATAYHEAVKRFEERAAKSDKIFDARKKALEEISATYAKLLAVIKVAANEELTLGLDDAGRIDAVVKEVERGIEVYRDLLVEGTQLSTEAANVGAEIIAESKTRLEEMIGLLNELQKKRDALTPIGSSSPVEQPTGLIAGFAGFAGPQVAGLPDVSEIQELQSAFESLGQSMQVTASTVAGTIGQTVDTLISGIAGAIAAAATGAADFADVMVSVFSAASSILIELALKSFIEIISMTISSIIAKNIEAYSAIPFVGLALGIAGAAAAIGAARGISSSEGGHAFAEGGIVQSPVLGLIGEAGPEVVLPLSNRALEEHGLGGGGGDIHITLQVDGREMAKVTTKNMPSIIRRKLGPIF